MDEQIPSNIWLNYFGIAVCCVSLGLYMFVKDIEEEEAMKRANKNQVADSQHGSYTIEMKATEALNAEQAKEDRDLPIDDFFEALSPRAKRIVGLVITMVTGVLYGIAFIPVVLIGQYENNSNFLDYFHSYYAGIFVTSLMYLVGYSAMKKNKPAVIQNLFVPGFMSALVWSIGDIFYFLASGALPQAISYPISSIGPPVVSTLWGVFIYKEIKGLKNYVFLTAGMILALVASIIIGVSS